MCTCVYVCLCSHICLYTDMHACTCVRAHVYLCEYVCHFAPSPAVTKDRALSGLSTRNLLSPSLEIRSAKARCHWSWFLLMGVGKDRPSLWLT